MADSTRVKINIYSGDIEFEGTEEFVSKQLDQIATTIHTLSKALIATGGIKPTPGPSASSIENVNSATEGSGLPDNFGEYLNKFPKPKNLQQVEQILIAGHYRQKLSSDNAFETSEANKLLQEQGIQLTNPTQSINSLISGKLVIIIGKRGKLKRFRLSPSGEETIQELLSKSS